MMMSRILFLIAMTTTTISSSNAYHIVTSPLQPRPVTSFGNHVHRRHIVSHKSLLWRRSQLPQQQQQQQQQQLMRHRTGLHVDTTSTPLPTSSLSQEDSNNQVEGQSSNHPDTPTRSINTASINGEHMSSNAMNVVDGVIRWKDILRSTHPISCDLDDEECLKRQKQLTFEDWKMVHHDDDDNDNSNTADLELSRTDQRNIILAVLGTIATIATMMVQSGPGAYRYYLAGAICATASHVIPVPIDTVKTRKQVDPKFAKLSFVAAFVKIWNQEGMHGLLAGLGPTAIGYALEGGIKFGVYEAMKPIVAAGLSRVAQLSSYLVFVQSRIVSFAICAAISGVAASIVLCPMEALRIRMVANPSRQQQQQQQQRGSGWFHTAIQMIKTEGITSFVKGMEPMIYKQVPYTITKNVAFDIMTRYVYTTLQTTWQMTTIGPLTKFIVPFLAAAAASILSCLSSQPGDVLLSLVNAQQHDVRRTRDIIRDVLRSEKGWKGFYIGTKARLLHVGIVVTLQLLIYDMVKRICGIAATGIAK